MKCSVCMLSCAVCCPFAVVLVLFVELVTLDVICILFILLVPIRRWQRARRLLFCCCMLTPRSLLLRFSVV